MPQFVETEPREEGVRILRINRPETRNALSPEVMEEIATELERLDADPETRCIVLTGSDAAFASADIRALREQPFEGLSPHPSADFWHRVAAVETPILAAVSGWALGGGFELALACDLIVASETAEFGQPEITLGIIPGGGGTQRIARVVGKHRAMELVLTGRRIDAHEAADLGLVNTVVKQRDWFEQSLELAGHVARRPPIAARLAKQAVLAADEATLTAGLEIERGLHKRAMATEDRVEGMDALLEQRQPRFRGR